MNGKIEQLIISEQYEEAWFAIAAYEKNCPQDSDIDTYKFICLSNADEPQMALQYAYAAMQNQPYVADVHYNCAYAYQFNCADNIFRHMNSMRLQRNWH